MLRNSFFTGLISIGVIAGIPSTPSVLVFGKKKMVESKRVNRHLIHQTVESNRRLRRDHHQRAVELGFGERNRLLAEAINTTDALSFCAFLSLIQDGRITLENEFVQFIRRLYWLIRPFPRLKLVSILLLTTKKVTELTLQDQENLNTLNSIFDDFMSDLDDGSILSQQNRLFSILQESQSESNFEEISRIVKEFTSNVAVPLVDSVNSLVCSTLFGNWLDALIDECTLKASSRTLLSFYRAIRQFFEQSQADR